MRNPPSFTARHRGSGVAVIALLLAGTASGCSEIGHGCAAMGCAGSLIVHVPSSTKMPDGAYRVELTSSLGSLAVECTLTDKGATAFPSRRVAHVRSS